MLINKPTKIVGIGLGYKKSYENSIYPSEPVIFLKGTNSIIYNGDNIIYPNNVSKVWAEGELAIIIGKDCKNIEKTEVNEYILGYTIANDITADNIYGRDHHLARSKSLDTFCPLGPQIVKDINPDNLQYKTFINSKLVQEANTKDSIYTCYEIVSMISKLMTLYKGDIIISGTHPGHSKSYIGHLEEVGIIKPGDYIRIEFEDIGTLENDVI